jgi:WD40 repeat protein
MYLSPVRGKNDRLYFTWPGGESFFTWSRDKTVRFWNIDNAFEKEFRNSKN